MSGGKFLGQQLRLIDLVLVHHYLLGLVFAQIHINHQKR